jgi:hypothetical protein
LLPLLANVDTNSYNNEAIWHYKYRYWVLCDTHDQAVAAYEEIQKECHMSRIFTPAVDAATGPAGGRFARVTKASRSLLKIMKVKGPALMLAGATAAAVPQYSLAQSSDRIEGGRAIQIMPVPQTLGVYNGASVSTGRLRANRTSPARTRLAAGQVQQRR